MAGTKLLVCLVLASFMALALARPSRVLLMDGVQAAAAGLVGRSHVRMPGTATWYGTTSRCL